MSTTAVSNSNWWIAPTTTDSSSTDSKGTNNLSNFDTFMKLLATELQNQDPTNPVSNTEYIAQMAQINTLSQLQNMSNSMDSTRAYSLIGKTVAYQTTDSSGNTITSTGTVKSVITKDNASYLYINGETISLSAVQAVTSGTTTTNTTTNS